MKPFHQLSGFLKICVQVTIIVMLSCQSEVDPDNNGGSNNNNNNNNTGIFTPDELSEFLVLKDATKITGSLPAAPDRQLMIDVKDTIFVVKGHPLGNRINFLKDPSQNVTGFYVYVEGSTYYFDVPETIYEDQYVPTGGSDTTSVIVLDIDPTLGDEDVPYPFTTEITIQPHDDSGAPLDEFERWITVEDPQSSCNSILRDANSFKVWVWDFTVRINNGEIVNVWAPGISADFGNEEFTGCCKNGKSDYGPLASECGSTDPENLVTFYSPDQFYLRPYEFMWFYAGGDMEYSSGEIYLRADPEKTDFCHGNGMFLYYHKYENFIEDGLHDFVPGASTLSIDFDVSVPNRPPRMSNISYTCHSLIMDFGSEGDKFSALYHTMNPDQSDNDYRYYYYP